MTRTRSPNYLALILTILGLIAVGMAGFVVLAALDSQKQDHLSLVEENLIAKNLVSYLKKEIATRPQIINDTPTLGQNDAPITIFEFSSFGCPYGRQAAQTVADVLKKYPNQIKLVWKDLPLAEVYPIADLAHLAARCAQKQDNFWAYHDRIWPLTEINVASLEKIAEDLKLNLSAFKNCLADKTTSLTVVADETEADRLMIPAVPYFYINDQELMGTATIDDFSRIIETELNR